MNYFGELMSQTARTLIGSLDIFSFPSVRMVRFRARHRIYDSGSNFDGIYVIKNGLVKNIVCCDNLTVISAISLPGDLVGCDSFYVGVYLSKSVAVSPVDALWVPRETFFRLMEVDLSFRSALYEFLGQALSDSIIMIQMLAKASAEAKLAFLLLKIGAALSENFLNGISLDVGLSRIEMGKYLGLNRNTITRKLRVLADKRYVRIQGRTVHFLNVDGLREICDSAKIPLNFNESNRANGF